MVVNTKIYTGIAIGTLVIGTFIFRKPISRALFGATAFNRRAINKAKKEWKEWQKGETKEGSEAIYDRLKSYWDSVGWSESRWTPSSVPWSGAFISHIMKESGAKDDFKYDSSHSVYIRDAITSKKNKSKKPFKGYEPSEMKLRKGDLICYPRQSGIDYDTTHSYKSHCDLVISIKKGVAKTIGGNVNNSVSTKEIALNRGKIKDEKYHVVIRNNK
jgi:hypothetical protein